MLSDVLHRVLAHLPIWRNDEDRAAAEAHEVEAGGRSIQSYTTPELTARLTQDPHTPVTTEAETIGHMTELIGKGLAAGTGAEETPFTMTEAGAAKLIVPPEATTTDTETEAVPNAA